MYLIRYIGRWLPAIGQKIGQAYSPLCGSIDSRSFVYSRWLRTQVLERPQAQVHLAPRAVNIEGYWIRQYLIDTTPARGTSRTACWSPRSPTPPLNFDYVAHGHAL